ncbi:MAG: helix-turn-helix domain-containing protein [Clostridia bacterium]|nr:helix-turn-helix domain-containing protein [Clostridia bacterium]
MEAELEMSVRRMADLERRVLALEERARRVLWSEEMTPMSKDEELTLRYGEYVDKTVAAQILGVTRATVYAMLADGRIMGACSGRRVDVRSIARYMQTPRGRGTRRTGMKAKEKCAADMTLSGQDGIEINGGKSDECA